MGECDALLDFDDVDGILPLFDGFGVGCFEDFVVVVVVTGFCVVVEVVVDPNPAHHPGDV